MTFDELKAAISDSQFSAFDSETERCLWCAIAEGWESAHIFVEELPEPGASWIHGMLHREEGDSWNADYWYSRAGKSSPPKGMSYQEEWTQIAKALLA